MSEILARVIDLLAEHAPAPAFDEATAEAEEMPAGPEKEQVLVALARAGRVREQIVHHQRREHELQALFETARDLSSLRDVDEVLAAIVRRVRQLLGADSGYLALVDEETGEAYMRITAGTVSSAIEAVRLKPGRGIGGWIIQTGQPFRTSHYLADTSIDHDPAVDGAVARDGVHSIGGVPIKVKGRTIGALFIADRHEQSYDSSAMALLTSLADQASVVLENARLFEELQATADDLRVANEELRQQGRNLERASAAHEQLMPLALGRVSAQEFTEIVADMVGGAVVFVDHQGGVLATAEARGHGDTVAVLVTQAERTDSAESEGAQFERSGGASRLSPEQVAVDDREVWAVSVRAGEETFGRLLFAVPTPIGEPEVRTLERTAQTAALLQLMERQTTIVEQQLRGELIDDLLAEREPDWEGFERRAQRSGLLDLSAAHVVFVVSPTQGKPRRQLLRACADLSSDRGGLATEYAGQVVLLFPESDIDSAVESVTRRLPRLVGAPVTAGAAGPANSARNVRTLYQAALRCHRLLVALGRSGEVATIEDLGTLGVVLEGTSRTRVVRLVEDRLGRLLRYDRENNAPLVETLSTFFAEGQNPRASASKLHVHPNTVYQRLERIDQVLGHTDWRKPQGALEMQLALQFHRILSDIPLHELLDR